MIKLLLWVLVAAWAVLGAHWTTLIVLVVLEVIAGALRIGRAKAPVERWEPTGGGGYRRVS